MHPFWPSRALLEKALLPMVWSAVASERSSSVSLVLAKAYSPIEVTLGGAHLEGAGDCLPLLEIGGDLAHVGAGLNTPSLATKHSWVGVWYERATPGSSFETVAA